MAVDGAESWASMADPQTGNEVAVWLSPSDRQRMYRMNGGTFSRVPEDIQGPMRFVAMELLLRQAKGTLR